MTVAMIKDVLAALKDQPVALAMVIVNLALIALFWVVLTRVDDRSRANNEAREARLAQEEREVRELLARCFLPQSGVPLPLPRPEDAPR